MDRQTLSIEAYRRVVGENIRKDEGFGTISDHSPYSVSLLDRFNVNVGFCCIIPELCLCIEKFFDIVKKERPILIILTNSIEVIKDNIDSDSLSFGLVSDTSTIIDFNNRVGKISYRNLLASVKSDTVDIVIIDVNVLVQQNRLDEIYNINKTIIIFSSSPITIVGKATKFINVLSSLGNNNIYFYSIRKCRSISFDYNNVKNKLLETKSVKDISFNVQRAKLVLSEMILKNIATQDVCRN